MSDQIDLPRDELPRLLLQREVAEHFRCSTRTIRNWTKKGVLKPIHIGTSTFYQRDEVERLSKFGTDGA